MNRAALADIDAAMRDVRRAFADLDIALDRLRRRCRSDNARAPVPAEVQDMQRRAVVAQTWPYDPRGPRNHIGPMQYAQELAL